LGTFNVSYFWLTLTIVIILILRVCSLLFIQLRSWWIIYLNFLWVIFITLPRTWYSILTSLCLVVSTFQSRLCLRLKVKLTVATFVCFNLYLIIRCLISFALGLTRKETYFSACSLNLLLVFSCIFTSTFWRKHFTSRDIRKGQAWRDLNVVLLKITLDITIKIIFSLDNYLFLLPSGSHMRNNSLFCLSFTRYKFIFNFYLRHIWSWR
jgi:hypothetical protein